MTLGKRIGWVLLGGLLGISVSGSLRAEHAQNPPTQRFIALMRGDRIDGYNAYLVKDTKTGACWLTIKATDPYGPVALAPAPAVSCEQ